MVTVIAVSNIGHKRSEDASLYILSFKNVYLQICSHFQSYWTINSIRKQDATEPSRLAKFWSPGNLFLHSSITFDGYYCTLRVCIDIDRWLEWILFKRKNCVQIPYQNFATKKVIHEIGINKKTVKNLSQHQNCAPGHALLTMK